MKNSYSMQGFDLTVGNNLIEMRAQGDRASGAEISPARIFASISAKVTTQLILYDIRDSDYQLTELEWEERGRFVARLFKGFQIAYVIRNDQREQARLICRAHARNGDEADYFTSKTKARNWLLR